MATAVKDKIGQSVGSLFESESSFDFEDLRDTLLDIVQGKRDLLAVTLSHLSEILSPWKVPEILQGLQTLRAKALQKEAKLVPVGTRVTDRPFLLRMRMYVNLANSTYHVLPSTLKRDVRRHAGMKVRYLKMTGSSYKPAFFIATSPDTKEVVVCVRGTVGLSDVITDLTAEPTGIITGGYVHPGLYHCALYLLVEHGQKIYKLLRENPTYNLTMVGHSLGAGTGALFTYIVNTMYKERFMEEVGREVDVRAVCFATPATMSKEMSEECRLKAWVVSVVLDTDIVPRLSVANMVELERMLKVELTSQKDLKSQDATKDLKSQDATKDLKSQDAPSESREQAGGDAAGEAKSDAPQQEGHWADPRTYWQRRQQRKQAQRQAKAYEADDDDGASSQFTDTMATLGSSPTSDHTLTPATSDAIPDSHHAPSPAGGQHGTAVPGTEAIPSAASEPGAGTAVPGGGEGDDEDGMEIVEADEDTQESDKVIVELSKKWEMPEEVVEEEKKEHNVITLYCPGVMFQVHKRKYFETVEDDEKPEASTASVLQQALRSFPSLTAATIAPSSTPSPGPPESPSIQPDGGPRPVEKSTSFDDEFTPLGELHLEGEAAAGNLPETGGATSSQAHVGVSHVDSDEDQSVLASLPEESLKQLEAAEDELVHVLQADAKQSIQSQRCVSHKFAVFLVDKPTGERPVDSFSVIKLRRAYLNHMPWRYRDVFPKYYPPDRLAPRVKGFFENLFTWPWGANNNNDNNNDNNQDTKPPANANPEP